MESFREIFLEGIVLENLDLEKLGNGTTEDRSRRFLQEIGYGQKHEYILKALKQKLPEGSSLPEGTFFVFTPDEGFIYRKNDLLLDSKFGDIVVGNGTMQEVLDSIGNLARRRAMERKQTDIKVLFYSHESQLKFERLVQDQGFRGYANTGVAHIGGLGNIMCRQYHN